jgi:hypothetical protein
MASSGCYEPEPLGGTSQSATVLGALWPADSIGGARMACGRLVADGGTAAGPYPGEGKLGAPLCGWHHGASPSARCWSQGKNPEGEALGRSHGGLSTKVHLRAEGGGKLITLVLTLGQRHEAPVFPQLMAQGAVKGAKGRPRLRSQRVVGDKAYSSRAIRRYAHQHGIRTTIPRKRNEWQNQELGLTRLIKVLAIEFGAVRTGSLETYPQEYPSSMRPLA